MVFVRLERGQRVDAPDAQHIAVRTPLKVAARIAERLGLGVVPLDVTQPAHTAGQVLRGFVVSNPSGTVVRIARDDSNGPGAAVLSAVVDGELIRGVTVDDDPATVDLDVASLPAAIYGVWVRAALRDEESRTRAFWLQGSPAAEQLRPTSTRRNLRWEAAVETTSPGPEWLQIASFDRNTMVFTDTRSFLFDTQGTITDAQWGSANDRSASRTTRGVAGLERLVRAFQRQVQDIIGGGSWASAIAGTVAGVGARSLTQLNAEKLGLSGQQIMSGPIPVDTDQAYDLGASTLRWRDVFARDLNFVRDLVGAATGDQIVSFSGAEVALGNRARIRNSPGAGGSGILGRLLIAAGETGTGLLELWGHTVRMTPTDRVEIDNRRLRFTNSNVSNPLTCNPAATTGIRNEVCAKNVIKTWVEVAFDGVNLDVANNLLDGFNVSAISWQAGLGAMRITFAEGMASTAYHVDWCWNHAGTSNPYRTMNVSAKALAYVDVQLFYHDAVTGIPTPVNMLTTAGGTLSVSITGFQAA